MTIKELIEKYEREIDRLDADMRDSRDNGFRAGKQAVLIMVVGDLKAMKAQPKMGHWIRDTITDIYHCSECRSICHQDPKSKDDYCRYCGARMVEPQESEDKE